jgi:iron-sulfur cluster assembly protein
MFTVTESAAEQIRSAASRGGADGMALRLAAVRHDDGSFDYRMGFDAVSDDDISFRQSGVEIVMAPEFVPLLDETTLDFVEMDDGQHQFIFLNPRDVNYVPPKAD